ncbi:hypothetical protein NST28_22715 [Paenibacillus sp. FSL R10-2791]|uniref:hypothetical protein n=1 Tax=Paenibacillus sp. FSL R10-2791 TaxID=2954695 RepID=UPI0030FBABE3
MDKATIQKVEETAVVMLDWIQRVFNDGGTTSELNAAPEVAIAACELLSKLKVLG